MHETKRKTRVSGGDGLAFFFFFPKRHNKLLTYNVKEPGFETVIRIRNLNAGTWPCLSNIPYKSCSCQKNEPVHFTIKAAALTVL